MQPSARADDVSGNILGAASLEEARPPVDVPNHDLLRRIGGGGAGQVWLARHRVLKTLVAVKLISDRIAPIELDRIIRREKIPDHPNLVPIRDGGVCDGWLHYSMPLADDASAARGPRDLDDYTATTLALEMKRRGRLSIDEVIAIGAALAEALEHLHLNDFVHGDIKPANILLLNGRWCVGDFGGGQTEGWMAPEREHTRQLDVYSLGMLLFVMLTAQPPRLLEDFDRAPLSHLGRDPRLEALRNIIIRATLFDRLQRYQSAGDVRRALEALPGPASRTSRWWNRLIDLIRERRVLAAAVTLAVLAIGASVLVPRWREPATTAEAAGGAAAADGLISSFELDFYKGSPGSDTVIPAFTFTSDTVAHEHDAISAHVELVRPAYCYLLTADTNGVVTPRPHGSVSAPQPVSKVRFPPEPGSAYVLADGPGVQAIAIVVSEAPLATFEELAEALQVWTPPAQTSGQGPWRFDGDRFVPLSASTRGEVRPITPAPAALVGLIEALQQGCASSASRAATPASRLIVTGIAFEVRPRSRD